MEPTESNILSGGKPGMSAAYYVFAKLLFLVKLVYGFGIFNLKLQDLTKFKGLEQVLFRRI